MSRRLVPILPALAAALHAATFLGYGPCDDDYITYRYARNLVEGHGPVFNLGERVEGFSAPGWMLAVAGALELGIDPALFSVLTSIAASALAAFCIGRVAQRARPDSSLAAPAWLVACSPAIAWHAIVGLGTVLVAALLALWVERWDRAVRDDRPAFAAAAVLGLAALVRNEAILFAVPFAFFEWRRARAPAALIAFAPLGAWQVFRVAYYGRIVPITYEVKKLPFLDDVHMGVEYLAKTSAATGLLVGLALAVVVLARRTALRDGPLRAASLGCVAYVVYVVYVGGDFMKMARFFVPILPLVAWLGCEGFRVLFPSAGRLAWLAFALFAAWNQTDQGRRPELYEVHIGAEPRWRAMGNAVAARVPPETKVALAPIGAFGWTSRLYIVDMLGLTNTAIVHAPPDLAIPIKGHQRYDAEWVLAQRPEMIIIGNGWVHPEADGSRTLVASAWEKTLLAHPRFDVEYLPLQIEVEGSYPLVFYWRRDTAPPKGSREV